MAHTSDPRSSPRQLHSRKRRQLVQAGAGLWAVSSGLLIRPASARSSADMPNSILEASKSLRSGAYSSEELTNEYLRIIDRLNGDLNAFTLVAGDDALAQARRLDEELRAGKDRGLLHGIPIGHKDNIDTQAIRSTVGSEFFKDRMPSKNATVVLRLAKAGAIMLGKTNMNEFAAGVSGTNAYFGDAHNPWDVARSPGGSSGGTGAAIASGMCLAGTGTDTGGSVRVPASWNGIVGIRPTFGRVSLHGVYPRAYSLDCAGPLGRTVTDTALMLGAMAAYDDAYDKSLNEKEEDYQARLGNGIKGMKIGIIKNYTFRNVDDDVAKSVESVVEVLSDAGANVTEVDIPLLGGALEYGSLFNILLYEFNQILGDEYRAEPNKKLFGPIVRDNITKGEQIDQAFYNDALQKREHQRAEFRRVFNDVDALITPTLPTTAPLLNASGDTYDRGRQFMLPFSWTGVPSISVPCGFDSIGMPIGVQFVGDDLSEAMLLRLAAEYERRTDHHTKRPPIHG